MAVQFTEDPTFATVREDVLFPMDGYLTASAHAMYDVSPDDRRFVMLRTGGNEGAASGGAYIVINWFEELRQRMGN